MRILIADDERIIADTLALIFRARNIDAMAVYSGESALAMAEDWHPDFLICDVIMGGINGFEVGAFFREHLPGCNVVLFSGHATADMQLGIAEAAKQFDILMKPIHPRVLLDYVATHAQSCRPQ